MLLLVPLVTNWSIIFLIFENSLLLWLLTYLSSKGTKISFISWAFVKSTLSKIGSGHSTYYTGTSSKVYFGFIDVLSTTLRSLINVQGDKFSKKNKRTGRKSSSISVQGWFFSEWLRNPLDARNQYYFGFDTSTLVQRKYYK